MGLSRCDRGLLLGLCPALIGYRFYCFAVRIPLLPLRLKTTVSRLFFCLCGFQDAEQTTTVVLFCFMEFLFCDFLVIFFTSAHTCYRIFANFAFVMSVNFWVMNRRFMTYRSECNFSIDWEVSLSVSFTPTL